MWIWLTLAISIIAANLGVYIWHPPITGAFKATLIAMDAGGVVAFVKASGDLVKLGIEIKKQRAELKKLDHEEQQRASLITLATKEQSEQIAQQRAEWNAERKRINDLYRSAGILSIAILLGSLGLLGLVPEHKRHGTIGQYALLSFMNRTAAEPTAAEESLNALNWNRTLPCFVEVLLGDETKKYRADINLYQRFQVDDQITSGMYIFWRWRPNQSAPKEFNFSVNAMIILPTKDGLQQLDYSHPWDLKSAVFIPNTKYKRPAEILVINGEVGEPRLSGLIGSNATGHVVGFCETDADRQK